MYPKEVSFLKLIGDIGDPKNPPPAVGFYLIGMSTIWFNSYKYLEELFVTKNAFYTKHPVERSLGKPLLYTNIVNMDSDDPTYKKKRKALSAAFLKSKMTEIIAMIKSTALRCFAELQAKGDENTIDLNMYTSTVQAHIIVTLMVGPGHSFKSLPYVSLETGVES